MPTISLRLDEKEQEALRQIILATGAPSASAAIRTLIREWQSVPDRTKPQRIDGTEVLVSADELRSMLVAGTAIRPLLERTAERFRDHVKHYGWPLADIPAPLSEVLADLRAGGERLGSAYLHAVFPSFWHADDGPAVASRRTGVMEKVLEYRMGLNKTGEVFDIHWAEVRRAFIVQRKTVSFFQPKRAHQLYQRFCPPGGKTWDPSGGFGARMLGFCSAVPGGTYFANEPATMTFADLERLSQGLNHIGANTAVVQAGSEHGHPAIQAESLDLVFTSPPYFRLENYFDEQGQAGKHKSLAVWVSQYLRPTMLHAVRYLKEGGLLVLNTNQSEPYIKTASSVGLTLVADEDLPVKRDHFQKRKGQNPTGNERLIVWRKQ